jgi:hypothetical protein
MKLCSKLLVLAILVSTCALISCSGPTSVASSYQNVAISMAYYPICNGCGTFAYPVNPPGDGGIAASVLPECTASATAAGCSQGGAVYCSSGSETCITTGAIAMPQGGGSGGCIELAATVVNAPLNPTWTIIPAPVPSSATSNVGTFSSQIGGTIFYCAPTTGYAIYTGAQLAQAVANGIPQGTVEVVVTNPTDPNGVLPPVSAHMYFAVVSSNSGPPTSVGVGFNGISTGTTVTVPLGTTYTFSGYVTGDNAINACPTGSGPGYGVSYFVNSVLGGAGTGPGQFGTVTPANSTSMANVVYTAPTNYPSATVHTASIQVESTACPTIESTAITIMFP